MHTPCRFWNFLQVHSARDEIQRNVSRQWNVTDAAVKANAGGGGTNAPEVGFDADVLEELRAFYAPHNEALYTMLGKRLWD